MFDDEQRKIVAKIAEELGVPVAALLSVVKVESGGKIFSKIEGRLEPLIRFEGHYFDRLLKGDVLLEARTEGLANPGAGKVRNPRTQKGRWELLHRASRINRTAAFSSVSWGVGQVMGDHWKWLGYGSVDALVDEARSGLEGQVRVMARYIKKAGLIKALNHRDWVSFARRYNGSNFAKNKYDQKLAKACLEFSNSKQPDGLPQKHDEDLSDDRLMFGARGSAVKLMQREMSKVGYVLVADGLFGLLTDRVVRQFQKDHLLEATGIFGSSEERILRGSGFRRFSKLGNVKIKMVQR